MALIIEEINRARRVHARYRMEGNRFTLGRGYDNDVILEDAHVDAHHAEILLDDDGRYRLRDLNSVNGIQLLGNSHKHSVKGHELTEHVIESGDEIQLGKTHLRLSQSEATITPALPMHVLESLFDKLSHPATAVSLLFTLAVCALWASYLGYARTYEWPVAANLVAGSIIGLMAYAAAWAFIGRVVRHETHFFTHLSIATLGALVYTVWEWLSSVLAFNFATVNLITLLDFALLAVLFPAMLWCACFLALNFSSRWRWGAALLLPWTFLGLGLAEHIGEIRDFNEVPEISTEIKYQGLLMRDPLPMKQFIANSQKLFDIPLEEKEDKQESKKSATSTPATDGQREGKNAEKSAATNTMRAAR